MGRWTGAGGEERNGELKVPADEEACGRPVAGVRPDGQYPADGVAQSGTGGNATERERVARAEAEREIVRSGLARPRRCGQRPKNDGERKTNDPPHGCCGSPSPSGTPCPSWRSHRGHPTALQQPPRQLEGQFNNNLCWAKRCPQGPRRATRLFLCTDERAPVRGQAEMGSVPTWTLYARRRELSCGEAARDGLTSAAAPRRTR